MPGNDEVQTILVVDDEKSMREFLEIMLAKEGYQIFLAASGEEAFQILERKKLDLIVTDIRMKDIDGIEVLKKAKGRSPKTMVVMVSAFASAETAVEAMKEGAYDYMQKPFKVEELKKIVKDAIRSKRPLPRMEERINERAVPTLVV
ncbi:MAG: response regulator [Desulfatiglandales bacterium]|nr:response regulator [Desulfatiglandales bacterium]